MMMQRLLLYVLLCLLPLYGFADGNGALGHSYSNTACGLGYLGVSHVLGKRFSPAGDNQPAAFVISGLPACATVVKAFLYADASGNGDAQTAVITGPLLAPSFPMTEIGTAADKCWGYAKTISYRADITSAITGNGTYTVNGFSTGSPTDIDGATILVIYTDPTKSWQGTVVIDDGALEGQGPLSYNMHYSIPCAAISGTRAFMAVGDMDQDEGVGMNGDTAFSPVKYWNFFDKQTIINHSQTSSLFSINSVSDCYNIVLTGIYYQSACTACNAIPPMQVSANATSSRCDSCNGTAHVTATGGSGSYVYNWAPAGGNAADATGLCPGTYTVSVQSDCGMASTTVTVHNILTPFSLGSDIVVCNDSTVRLQPDDTSTGNFLWNTGATQCCITVSTPGTYWLRQADGCGSITDTINVKMISCDTNLCIYFPNAFTPNNDGRNDAFGPIVSCKTPLENYHLQIYDRWERMIFESRDVNYKWDGRYHGTPQDIGTYYYLLQYGSNGKIIKGNVTLVN